jgi:hypothetical protein
MSSEWVKACVDFEAIGRRCAILSIDWRQAFENGLKTHLLRIAPDELESVFCTEIARVRPEISGCEVAWLEYRPDRREWRALIYHGSLPRCPEGAEIQVQSLYPEDSDWQEPQAIN